MFKHWSAGVGGMVAAASLLVLTGTSRGDGLSTSFAIGGGYAGSFTSSFYPGYFGFSSYYHSAPSSAYSGSTGLGYWPSVSGSYSSPSVYSSYPYSSYSSSYPPYQGLAGRYPDRAWGRAVRTRIDVTVPRSDAVVTVNGQRTRQKGKQRRFWTPALALGRIGTYHFTARWKENGTQRTRSRKIEVRPGQRLTVDLTRPTGKLARRESVLPPAR